MMKTDRPTRRLTAIFTTLILLIIPCHLCTAKVKSYRNWHVFSIGPLQDKTQIETMADFISDYEDSDNVNILSDMIARGKNVEIAVSPYELDHVRSYLRATALPFTRTSTDLHRSLRREIRQNSAAKSHVRRRRSTADHGVELPHYYMLYKPMTEYLKRIVNASRGRAEMFNIGNSYEGKPMYGVTVNNGSGLPKVWIDGGIHAREWIAPATALHILHQLVFNESEELRKIVDSFQWFILPLANPDGYHFTWTDDRLWRKNRHPYGPCPDPCKSGIGVDLNRNFDFNWGRFSGSSPCSLNFHGVAPFSEPEARNMRDFILAEKHRMHVYFSLHAFLQYFIVPWVGERYRAPDYPELERVGNISTKAMFDVHGEVYQVVNFAEQMYLASGSSMDWVKAKAGVKYAYTIELRPSSRQPHFAASFQIQPSQIKPTGEEVMAGVLTTARLVHERLHQMNGDLL